ncbi:MAG: ribonuclease III [Patescibacteria group bacterium]|nr:ribonuclease III [bacterium]MDZ4240594.1 ribonuclease III [Patescibacteria group bacterium]
MTDFSNFEQKIGITFKNKDLLKQAFIHRSFINEHRDLSLAHNERLEFLGDAVLELAITHYLFEEYPEKTEGDLTAYRAALVNANSLSQVGIDVGINDFLLLSKGEAKDVGRARQFIIANAVEAIIGAIYLDQGYESAKMFVLKHVRPLIDAIIESGALIDAKSLFQERAQEQKGITPAYQILRETGPDHDKQFVVGVFLNETMIASGEGSSKQIAEQEAAKNALQKSGWK